MNNFTSFKGLFQRNYIIVIIMIIKTTEFISQRYKRLLISKTVQFCLLLLLVTSFSFAQTASKATTGTGLYKDKIFWINWDLNNNSSPEDPITNGTVRTFTSPSGIVYKVTISNIVVTGVNGFSSANVDSWGGNNMPFGYSGFSSNSTKVISLSNKIESSGVGDGSKVKFRITVTATLPSGTVQNAAALAIAGSESLFDDAEYYQLSVPTTSPVLRYLDKYIHNNDWKQMKVRLIVSNTGRTIKVTNPSGGDSKGDALLLAENVPNIDVELKGRGGQNVAIGVFKN